MTFQFNSTFRKLAILVTLVLGTSLILFNESSFSFHQHTVPQYVFGGLPKPASKVSRDYSIKPIAYIFPQYYTFEENSRLWGENFTEWSNVKKVTKNAFGLETIRPHKSIGFYNGLTYHTRKRQGEFLRESGFYGAVFHHYWFAGKPVMDHVIKAMMEDGEPNIPFMLNWANEPWTARWDGAADGNVLIAQDYGLQQAWRKHFDWLLPFFKHPQYIRSEGKVQFLVYNPSHMGHIAPQMFAAWRQWAVEEGLGGMDIIETRWGAGSYSWTGHPPDAINEFQPHAGGREWATLSSSNRLSRVYHRGTLACWDTTPRHPNDGKAVCLPSCHPNTWKHHLVEMFRKIKSDPNPVGAENFFFVNALNEWGEGNAIEPSAQFGDGYGKAMKEAMEITETEHIWPDVSTAATLMRASEMEAVMNKTADVCVLIRTSANNTEDKPFKLSAMIRSLQAQNNLNWRAVIYQSENSDFGTLDQLIVQALDARVQRVKIPINFTTSKGQETNYRATDWLIANLTDASPGCASAKYLLVTDGSNIYDKTAFETVVNAKYDLLGLNVESLKNIWNHPQLKNNSWADRCTRLEDPNLQLCNATAPTLESFDLSATLFDFRKYLQEGHTFSQFNESALGHEESALALHLTRDRGWIFTKSTSKTCHVRHNPAYTSCLKTGNFWFDSPILGEMGCYTSTDFMNILGKKSPYLRDFDLQFFREHGYCMRYKEGSYWNATHPPPPPKTSPAIESSLTEMTGLAPSTTATEMRLEPTPSPKTTSLSEASESVSLQLSPSESAFSQSATSSSIAPSNPTFENKKEDLNAELKQVVHT